MADQRTWIRLATALIFSTCLHLLLIFFPTIHLRPVDRSEKGAQIVLQTSIQPLPKPQAGKLPRRAQKSADRARRAQPAGADKSTSVELGKPAERGPENAKPNPEAESAQAAAPSEPQQQESSDAPENREPTSIQDADTPVYPPEAIQRGLESCVLAAVYISPSGDVQAVRILHADVPELFDQSVIDAQSAARYLPARQHGQNLPSRVLTVVTFVLEPDRVRNCAFKYAPAARRINALPVSTEIGPGLVEEALRATQ
jgi:protein TonB